jgi:hypothetical protein
MKKNLNQKKKINHIFANFLKFSISKKKILKKIQLKTNLKLFKKNTLLKITKNKLLLKKKSKK